MIITTTDGPNPRMLETAERLSKELGAHLVARRSRTLGQLAERYGMRRASHRNEHAAALLRRS